MDGFCFSEELRLSMKSYYLSPEQEILIIYNAIFPFLYLTMKLRCLFFILAIIETMF